MEKIDQQLRSNDCGISAIKIIYDIYKKPISREYIANSIRLDEKGSYLIDIENFFSANGFQTDYELLDVNYLKDNLDYLDNFFPFIFPIKRRSGLHYLVANGRRNRKIRIYDPSKGSIYYLSIEEIKKISHYTKTDWDLVNTEKTLLSICSEDISSYNLNFNEILIANESNATQIFNKLSYFSYLKNNFPFKDHLTEKNFLIDLLKNQEISKIPKQFRTLYYSKGKIKITAPLILTVKPFLESKELLNDNNEKNIYWELFRSLGRNKKLWYIYIIAAIFSSGMTQLAVFTNQILIDHILPSFNLAMVSVFAIGLGIYKLFDITTSAYKRFVGIHLANILDKHFLKEFDTKTNSFSLAYIQSFKKGDLIERISDSLKLKHFFVQFFTGFLIDLIISLYSLLILLYINWELTILVLIIMIIFYIWFKFITPFLKRNERIRYVKKADFLSKMIEKIEGINVIKSFGIEQLSSNKILSTAQEYLQIQMKNGYINLINSIVVSVVIGVATITIIVKLTNLAITDQMITLGQIITFMALSNKIFASLRNILNQNLTLQENEVILRRFIDYKQGDQEKISEKGIKNFVIKSLELRNIRFGYKSTNDVLKNINLEIWTGEKIRVKGKNGSGKSTLSKVLTTLYKSEKGSILINGDDHNFFNIHELKNKILLISNEDILFNQTLEENICLGKQISTSNIIELAKKIDFFDFVSSKEEKLDYLINENGKNLSTGQRKKILLMRALLSGAELIILDEVLSGIDKDSRMKIERYINTDSRMFIIISHEPIDNISFSKNYELKNGKIDRI